MTQLLRAFVEDEFRMNMVPTNRFLPPGLPIAINTSNPDKRLEFKRIFERLGISIAFTDQDLDEIDAIHTDVIRHKASRFRGSDRVVIVEDTRLDVEGENVGIHVRWKLNELTRMTGRRAHWVSLIAYRDSDRIVVAEGSVHGVISQPRGPLGFGFDPVFLPDGRDFTLGEDKPDAFNARALSAQNLIAGAVALYPPLDQWDGKWQEHP